MKLVRQLQPVRRHCIAVAAQWTGVAAWIAAGLFAVFVLEQHECTPDDIRSDN